MTDPASGLTVLEGKRRVDGIELQSPGASRRTGTSTAASPTWTARSSGGPRPPQGKHPLGVADVSGSVWTIYRLGGGCEVGGGVRGTSGSG